MQRKYLSHKKMAFCNEKIAIVVVKIHSSFDGCYDLQEGNKVISIRSYKMFLLFVPKKRSRDEQKLFCRRLFIVACFIMEKQQ